MYDMRILVDETNIDDAINTLEEAGIRCDLDDGDRIMVSTENLAEIDKVLSEAFIDYEEI